MTLGLTSWSHWVLTHTFGIGFLTPTQTLIAWTFQLAAYIGIACVEEAHLKKEFGDAFRAYRERVPFFIPMLRSSNRSVEIAYAVVVPSLFLCTLVVVGR